MIDSALAAFLEEGLAMHIATRNARLEPNGVRATAVTVENDGTHLVVYVPRVAAGDVLTDLESNGQAAVVFCRPVDERSCQVKGVFVESREAGAADLSEVTAQWEGFLRGVEAVGIPRAAFERWVTWPAVAIRLRVTALFDQTPGPQAGALLT